MDEDARRRLKRAVWALVIGVVLAVALGVSAVVVAVVLSGVRSEEVAERVAPEVIRQVIADSRAQRVANARGVLGAANQVLASQERPTVADPGPAANAEQVLAAASSAQVLSVLPDDVASRLGGQASGGVLVLPSAAGTTASPTDDVDDDAAAPRAGTPGAGTSTGSAPGATPSQSGNGRAPAVPQPAAPQQPAVPAQPSPRTTERRLIPPLLPFDFPILGT